MTTKYTKEVLQEAVDNSSSVAGVLRFLGLRSAGGTNSHISKKIKEYGIDTTHFTGQAHGRGKKALNRKTKEQILIVLPAGSNRPKPAQLRRAMLSSGLVLECNGERCDVSESWKGSPITLEINHINGDWLNNTLENLEFLCPNCHSQQESSNMPHKYRSKYV